MQGRSRRPGASWSGKEPGASWSAKKPGASWSGKKAAAPSFFFPLIESASY
ncbi:MAG: hypothetical protein HQL02_11605 [Nitrospirae bacterium]|nr:hypothetical protein [Nitrospirota bacterium]